MTYLGDAKTAKWERREYSDGSVGIGFWDDKAGFVNIAHDVRLDSVELLLAVPDLLATLQRLSDWCSARQETMYMPGYLLDGAREAIRKATEAE